VISIRPALESDLESLCSFDLIARQSEERREFIGRSVASGNCYVAVADPEVIGYAVLNYTFYYQGCIDMLYVAGDQRRHGVGTALLAQMERLCQTPKLFTSTNLSNLPMQSLLARCGYALSGVIHNLDEGDPAIGWYKRCFARVRTGLVKDRRPDGSCNQRKAHHTMAKFTGRASDVVCGTVFAVTPGKIQNADKYEVAAVKRVAVVLQSGVRAWAYVDARYAPSDS
jgi:GNAT superfamily N-acetyltransferase